MQQQDFGPKEQSAVVNAVAATVTQSAAALASAGRPTPCSHQLCREAVARRRGTRWPYHHHLGS
eukprot:COSAG01_NODE_69637_length_260_cov_64.478261_1_plen_63_part_10